MIIRPVQIWPMPAETDDVDSLRARARFHGRSRSSGLHDWANWVTNAAVPPEVLEFHLRHSGVLDPSLGDMGLDRPLASWSEHDWRALWTRGGHAAWSEVCQQARGCNDGSDPAALAQALVESPRIDAVSVVLHRLRLWDRTWAGAVLVRRVERLSSQIAAMGTKQGIRVVHAQVSPRSATLLTGSDPVDADAMVSEVQALVGVPVSLATEKRVTQIT